MQRWVSQLKKGLVELSVMAALGDGEAYGYQIVQRLGGAAGLAVSESTVYPILARLTKERLVSVRTADSPAGPPRRYYQLTSHGRDRLAEMGGHWSNVCESIDVLLKGDSGP
jgi:PadR family transcriptional regulator PadR